MLILYVPLKLVPHFKGKYCNLKLPPYSVCLVHVLFGSQNVSISFYLVEDFSEVYID